MGSKSFTIVTLSAQVDSPLLDAKTKGTGVWDTWEQAQVLGAGRNSEVRDGKVGVL